MLLQRLKLLTGENLEELEGWLGAMLSYEGEINSNFKLNLKGKRPRIFSFSDHEPRYP